ncbi:hypothetical protein JCM10207_006935 [Rhodosporidiobolus poonsookiae]
MPLDSNLFTLLVRPRTASPGYIDYQTDRSATGGEDEPAYTAHKDPFSSTITLLDPYTSSPLGSHTPAPPALPNAAANPKHRRIRLVDPEADVPLRSRTGLSWGWEMDWEGVAYRWERDVINPFGSERGFTLNVSRKPDPDFPVASFHPKRRGGSVEVFDYNLARVEPAIQDKKGLEITILLCLSFFIEHLFGLPDTPSASPSTSSPAPILAASSSASASPAPPLPPAPPRKRSSGSIFDSTPSSAKSPSTSTSPARPRKDRQGSSGVLAVNEVEVKDPSAAAVERACERCLDALKDPSLLYLALFTSSPACVPSVAALAEQVKRRRYKASGEEVRLFVDDSGSGSGEGGGREGKKFAAPPTSLRIYLSRIELAELLPNHRSPAPVPPKPPVRPPIDFDAPGAGTGTGEGKKEEGGGWRGFFGGR